MRFLYLFLLFIAFHFTSVAQPINPVQKAINDFATGWGMENAGISFMAYNLDSNKVLASYQPNIALIPASTTKLFTTAAALVALGPNYLPKTKIYYTGKIDSLGVLNGDIVVRGFGDPTLGSRYFYEWEKRNKFLDEWIKKVKGIGIKSINGRIITDGSLFGYQGNPDGWAWIDMGQYYGSGASGCSVYGNMAYLHFSTSSRVGGTTQIDSITPSIPKLVIDNQVKTYNGRGDNAYMYGSPYSYHRFIKGEIPRGRSNFEVKVSIPDPEKMLARVFNEALTTTGITIKNDPIGFREGSITHKMKPFTYDSLHLFTTYYGKPLDSIIYETNHHSVNFLAESVLCLLGYEKTGNGTIESSIDFIEAFWERRLGLSMYQTDGSGLSRTNAFSANHFIQLLKYMHRSSSYETFYNSLPVAGKSGTLKWICNGEAAEGQMHAKSGTLKRVKSYSGYIESDSGNTIAFALIVNNDRLSGSELVNKMEHIFNVISKQ